MQRLIREYSKNQVAEFCLATGCSLTRPWSISGKASKTPCFSAFYTINGGLLAKWPGALQQVP